MKYTVEGFSQKALIDYGLDEKDALILRYFIDFKDSGKMKMKVINKVPYYWLKGASLLEQLPILKINNIDVLRRRLKKMTVCGILMHEHVLEGGSYAFYAVGEKYENLLVYDNINSKNNIEKRDYQILDSYFDENKNDNIYERITKKSEPYTEKSEVSTQKTEIMSEKSEASDSKVGAKDYSINKSINNNIYSSCDKSHETTEAIRVPYDEIINIFNDICTCFPKVKVRNNYRDSFIKKMYSNLGIETIKTVFHMAEESDYLSGRNGKWLNCSFDWIIKENNYVKVLEGNYSRNSDSYYKRNNENRYSSDSEFVCEENHDSDIDDYDDTSEDNIVINKELLEDL